MTQIIGVDVGGTFTDFIHVGEDGRIEIVKRTIHRPKKLKDNLTSCTIFCVTSKTYGLFDLLLNILFQDL